jgi:hypothetical protein
VSSHWGLAWLRLTYEWSGEFTKANVNFWDKQICPARFAILGPESIEKNCGLCGEENAEE